MANVITLPPEEIIRNFPCTTWTKTAPTRIKPITEQDRATMGPTFTDLEGRVHQVTTDRCLCIGYEGEMWTCSKTSLERDRYPISEPDAQGYRLYLLKHPQPISCFDVPFAFRFSSQGKVWQSQPDGGIVTWNGKHGSELEMRIVKRTIFMTTYTRSNDQI